LAKDQLNGIRDEFGVCENSEQAVSGRLVRIRDHEVVQTLIEFALCRLFAGVQLSVVRKKLNVVADGVGES